MISENAEKKGKQPSDSPVAANRQQRQLHSVKDKEPELLGPVIPESDQNLWPRQFRFVTHWKTSSTFAVILRSVGVLDSGLSVPWLVSVEPGTGGIVKIG